MRVACNEMPTATKRNNLGNSNKLSARAPRVKYVSMCFFNFPNKSSIKARLKGIEEFTCGHCPECLQKKSRMWALRCSMESRVSPGVMVTLTYDTYKVLYGKKTNEENPPDPTIPLSKRHCQLFIKRLRKHFEPLKLKYLLSAERGRRGRAHYHALLFGVQFNDLVKYKKSDRGNWIYKSKTLEKIWSHGICTVDCVNLSAKTARYCTKYCAKDSGMDDTFMLFSRGIGDEMLLKNFNGKSYWIDGREYSIPKQIWQKWIERKYNILGFSRYIPKRHVEKEEEKIYNAQVRYEKCEEVLNEKIIKAKLSLNKTLSNERNFRKIKTFSNWLRIKHKKEYRLNFWESRLYQHIFALDLHRRKIRGRISSLYGSMVAYERGKYRNEIYQSIRDNDAWYKRYINYWQRKAKLYEKYRPTVEERILALPDSKYRSYKNKAILAKHKQVRHQSFVPPRSNTQAFVSKPVRKVYKETTFAPLSRHYRANDTFRKNFRQEFIDLRYYYMKVSPHRAHFAKFFSLEHLFEAQ